MKISPIRPSVIAVVLVALWAVGCTAPAGGSSPVPTQPAASVAPIAPSASPSAYAPSDDPYVDEYPTPKP